MSTPIADYAALGDGRTVALVSREGSVDWLCLPDLDSPACFAALLGTPDNGRWALGVRAATQVSRRYVGDSFVLETEYRTPTGRARALDWMPTRDGHADLSRKIEVLEGEVTVVHELVVRFDYGAVEPWVTSDGSALRIVAGPDSLTLRADHHSTDHSARRRRPTAPVPLDVLGRARGGRIPGVMPTAPGMS